MDKLRSLAHKRLNEAHARFDSSLPPSTHRSNFATDFHIKDNYDASNGLILCNPTITNGFILFDEVASETRRCGAKEIALSIAFTWNIRDFRFFSDSPVAERIVGLFMYYVLNLCGKALEEFITKCRYLRSLTIAYMDEASAKFLRDMFAKGLLPHLEFLEVSNCSDDAIAAMSSAPYLKQVVFRVPHHTITNNGFKRLIENGGAKKLRHVTVSVYNNLFREQIQCLIFLFLIGKSY